MRWLLCAGIVSISAVAAVASDTYSDITAQFAITGEEVVDPLPNTPRDRVALFLSGDGAKRIYDSIPHAAISGQACEEGLKLKKSGGLVCENHAGQSYSCSVGISLKNGQTRALGAC